MPAEQNYAQTIEVMEGMAKDALDQGRCVNAFMIGSTDSTGDSWCSDSREAEPVVENGLKSTSDKDLFIMVEVGSKEEWKSADNPFRKHPIYKLTVIPTLFKFKLDGGKIAEKSRLEGDSCKSADLVGPFLKNN